MRSSNKGKTNFGSNKCNVKSVGGIPGPVPRRAIHCYLTCCGHRRKFCSGRRLKKLVFRGGATCGGPDGCGVLGQGSSGRTISMPKCKRVVGGGLSLDPHGSKNFPRRLVGMSGALSRVGGGSFTPGSLGLSRSSFRDLGRRRLVKSHGSSKDLPSVGFLHLAGRTGFHFSNVNYFVGRRTISCD